MAAFGLNDQGKNSRGLMENLPYLFQDQMQNQFDRGNLESDQAAYLQNQYAAYLNGILNDPNGGFFSPGQIRDYGKIAMPGVDQANEQRLQSLDQLPQAIGWQTTGNALTDINNSRNNDYLAQLNSTIDSARANTNRDYSGLRDLSKQTYSTAQQNVQRLLPGGDMAAAAAARSFAPAMSAATRRLRTAGIDPNSPEASGILQGVDVARGHSMDDILAANNGSYINQLNSLLLGGLGNEQDLTKAQTDITRQLGLTQGDLTMQNTNTNAGINSGIATGNRNMSIQDQQLAQQLADLYNQANLQNISLQNQSFNQGVSGLSRGRAEQTAAAQGLGGLGSTLSGQGQSSLNSGLSFGNSAGQGFGQNLGIESQNAGWGTKLLSGALGAAGPLLNMVPYVGPFLGAAASLGGSVMGGGAAGGGYGGYANQGGYGGYGTPPFQGGGTPSNPSASWGNLLGGIGNLFKQSGASSYGSDGYGDFGNSGY